MAYAFDQKAMLKTECYSEKKVPLEMVVKTPREWWRAAGLVEKAYACTVFGLLVQVSRPFPALD